jgi:excisionase family DNA binding protein
MKALKSVVEAAGLLGISPWTVRNYVRTGKLRPVRIGRRVLLAEAELEQFIARSQQLPETQPDAGQHGDNIQEAVR